MTINEHTYGFRTTLNLPYEEAIAAVTQALKAEGFGVLTEIDVKSTLKKKIDADFRKYAILGACNPRLAHQALSNEMEIGLLLPCNVIVYDDEAGGSVVSIINPLVMMGVVDSSALQHVATEADARLRRVINSLAAS